MAKVSKLGTCPECDGELPDPKPEKCPHCGERLFFKQRSSEYWQPPKYIQTQFREMKEIAGIGTKKETEVGVRKIDTAYNAMTQFIRDASPKELEDGLVEAKLIMENIIHVDVGGTELAVLVGIGKQIGKLAERADGWFKDGGTTRAGKQIRSIQAKPSDEEWRESSSR